MIIRLLFLFSNRFSYILLFFYIFYEKSAPAETGATHFFHFSALPILQLHKNTQNNHHKAQDRAQAHLFFQKHSCPNQG